MNKGFTLVELLAVIVILAIIGGVAAISYTTITKKTEDDYYINLMDNLALSATNYFNDNRSSRPGFDNDGKLKICSKVNLKTLVDEAYIENVNDSKGNSCDLNNSYVYIKRDSNKQYVYQTYLICDNYTNIFEENEYCS